MSCTHLWCVILGVGSLSHVRNVQNGKRTATFNTSPARFFSLARPSRSRRDPDACFALDGTRSSSRPADSRRAGGDTIVEGRAARAGYVEGRARERYGCWCGHLQQNTTIKIYRLEDTVHNNQPINFNINCIIKQLISGIILRGLVLFMVD